MNQTYMKENKILPLLLKMALPMIISMFVNSLYNIVDSIFVAKISENAMTALSLIYPVQNLIMSVAVGIGVGINAIAALHLGAGEKERADAAVTQGMLLNIIHGIILNILGLMIMSTFLKLFTSNQEVFDMAMKYSVIVLCFSVIIMAGITFEKIFQAVGKMTITMVSLLSGCIINIILDPIFIFGLGPVSKMGIQGAALATGIGQTATLLIYLWFYIYRPLDVRLSKKHLKLNRRLCFRIYSIGIPATLNMALPSVLVSAMNGLLSAFSQSYVIVLGIYYKLQTFLYLTANGVVQGMRPLLSYNYGAGEYKRVQKIYKTAIIMIALIMILGTVLCIEIPGTLMKMFTSNPGTIRIGVKALRIISGGFIVSSVSVVSAGAFEALGKGVQSFSIFLIRYVIVIIPAAYIMGNIFGKGGIWNAFWIAEISAAGIAILFYHNFFYKNVKESFDKKN